MARPRFLVTELDADRARLRGSQATHLARALRARVGDEVELAHAGRVWLARVAALARGEVVLDVIAPVAPAAVSPPVVLACALFKFDRFEWMLEKAGELGASSVVPLVTRRTDAKNAAPTAARLERWRRILAAAAEQSHRVAAPELSAPRPLARYLEESRADAGARWIFSERGGAPAAALCRSAGAPLLLTGPEGGWTESELEAARQAGYQALSLGPHILRCETAVLAALALAGLATPDGPAPQPG